MPESSVPFELYKPQQIVKPETPEAESSVPFELYKPQLLQMIDASIIQSSVPFELYKPQRDEPPIPGNREIKCTV